MALVKPAAVDPPTIKGGPRERQGYETFVQTCAGCHGPGAMPMRSPGTLGADTFRRLVRQGPGADAAVS
jgi:mono/diheme cytochrome c family protein